jgi:hypothetical protein
MMSQDVRDLERRTFEASQELATLYREIDLLQRGLRKEWSTLPEHRAAAIRRIERVRNLLYELEGFFRHYEGK